MERHGGSITRENTILFPENGAFLRPRLSVLLRWVERVVGSKRGGHSKQAWEAPCTHSPGDLPTPPHRRAQDRAGRVNPDHSTHFLFSLP